MKRSLLLELLLAFALVISFGTAVDALVVNQATRGQFNRFVTASGQGWAQQVAPVLADYYARTGGWQGVDELLRTPWLNTAMAIQTPASIQVASTPEAAGTGARLRGMMGARMMGTRQTALDGMRHGETDIGASLVIDDMWGWMGLRLLLADAQGTVVADTDSALTGSTLLPTELAIGTPIKVNGQEVGVLLPVTAIADTPSAAADFLRAVNTATWLSSLAAAALASLLGLFLFRQIIAPVRAVTSAAQQIAAGSLEQRVPVSAHNEIGQLALTFNQMADTLARDQQLRRNMMADIAHELRTPLSVIQSNLEAILDGVLPADPQEIGLLHDETMLLTRLVADLRLLSLAEAGQLKLQCATTDLTNLIQHTLDHLRLQADVQQVTFVTELPPALPFVNVDADRIEQVLTNLLSNALRYTPTGNRITVRARTEASAKPPLSVVVEVVDTGEGIAATDLPYVFDRFYRADKSRNRASGGSGIGLALVKQLVEAHNGRVWVKSEPGMGATFAFSLPIASI